MTEEALSAEYHRQCRALADMINSPGWELVDKWLASLESMHAARILSGDLTGPAMDRKLGEHLAVKLIRAWPKNQAEQLKPFVK